MARKKRTPEENARREKIRELLQMANIGSMDDIQSLFKETIAEFIENGLDAEMDDELGYSRYDYKNKDTDNSRNGHSSKTLRTSFGDVEISAPRRNCLTSSSTLFTQPKAAAASPRTEASGFHPDRRSDSLSSTVQLSNLHLQFAEELFHFPPLFQGNFGIWLGDQCACDGRLTTIFFKSEKTVCPVNSNLLSR